MLFNVLSKRFVTIAAPKIKTNKLKPTGMNAYSPYVLYVKEQMGTNHDTLEKNSQRLTDIAKQWNALNSSQKKKYVDQSHLLKDEKIQEFEKLSLEEKQEVVTKDRAVRKERAKRRVRKERREMWESTNHPQRPLSNFTLFVKEQFEMKKKNMENVTPVSDFLKQLGETWKGMSESSKQKYTQESQKLRDEYKNAVSTWKKEHKDDKKSA